MQSDLAPSAGALAEELEEWLRAHAPSSPVRLPGLRVTVEKNAAMP